VHKLTGPKKKKKKKKKAAKTLHYNSKILNSNNKMKVTWNFVKSATGRKLSNNGILTYLLHGAASFLRS